MFVDEKVFVFQMFLRRCKKVHGFPRFMKRGISLGVMVLTSFQKKYMHLKQMFSGSALESIGFPNEFETENITWCIGVCMVFRKVYDFEMDPSCDPSGNEL